MKRIWDSFPRHSSSFYQEQLSLKLHSVICYVLKSCEQNISVIIFRGSMWPTLVWSTSNIPCFLQSIPKPFNDTSCEYNSDLCTSLHLFGCASRDNTLRHGFRKITLLWYSQVTFFKTEANQSNFRSETVKQTFLWNPDFCNYLHFLVLDVINFDLHMFSFFCFLLRFKNGCFILGYKSVYVCALFR